MASQVTLKNLISYLEHDGWDKLFEVVLADHMDGVADTLDEVAEATGDTDIVLATWLSAFEDFASRSYGDKGNVIDAYLAKRAFKETPRSRAYMKALRDSVSSLYEIDAAGQGGSIRLRDLVRGGEPVTIKDGALNLDQGWVVARVVNVLGRTEVTGTWLGLRQEIDRDEVKAEIAAALGRDLPMPWDDVDAGKLRRVMPKLTRIWLAAALEGDGEADEDEADVSFFDVTFPFAAGTTRDQVAAVLNAQPELRALDDRSWAWGESDDDDADFDAGPGMIEVSDADLTYQTMSMIEAEATMADLQDWLGDLVGEPKVEVTSLDQVLADPEMQAIFDEMDAEEGAANDR